MHPGLQQSAIVVSAISQAARGVLGPSGAVKICATGGVPGAGAGGAYSVAVCDGGGLMRELSVAHPAGTLLKEAVHGQQVSGQLPIYLPPLPGTRLTAAGGLNQQAAQATEGRRKAKGHPSGL